VHRLREGCRWRSLSEVYGSYTTVFNRYNRWSKRGLWQATFAMLVESDDPPDAAICRAILVAQMSPDPSLAHHSG